MNTDRFKVKIINWFCSSSPTKGVQNCQKSIIHCQPVHMGHDMESSKNLCWAYRDSTIGGLSRLSIFLPYGPRVISCPRMTGINPDFSTLYYTFIIRNYIGVGFYRLSTLFMPSWFCHVIMIYFLLTRMLENNQLART